MSHFSLMVTGQNIESQMLPFTENTDDCPKELLVFNDVEGEYREKYETETRAEFYCESNSSSGQMVSERVYNLINRPVGETVTVRFIKEDMDCLAYWKKNSAYRCGNLHSKEKVDSIWVRVIDVIDTTHPDSNICFEGTIQICVINAPKEIPHKEFYKSFLIMHFTNSPPENS